MQTLATRLATGDEAAFAELYDQCADRLYGFLTVRLGSRDAAADVLQETFLRAVKSRRQFRKVENPVAYLFQIARNEAARHKPWTVHHLATTDLGELADKNQSEDNDSEAIAAAIAKLAPEDRELIELKVYSGLTFREIADVVNRPQATVATRYRRALESMRGWLTKEIIR